MTLELSDKSNYLMGMLVLIGKDKDIENINEKNIRHIADEFGFNHYFVDESFNEVKNNKYIIEEPPKFTNQKIAEVFIKDAIRFAFSDHSIHLYEFQWLTTVASKNQLSRKWLLSEITEYLKNKKDKHNSLFEIQKYVEPVLNMNSKFI